MLMRKLWMKYQKVKEYRCCEMVMKMKVEFKTITPLWTGDAWQNCKEIRPSSILGSLRFWFEVLCYFNGIINDDYFGENGRSIETLNYDKFNKKLKEKIQDNLKNGEKYNINKLIDGTLDELNISLPSRIFGCTGWKGRIRIKEIEPIEDYENRLNLPKDICINKKTFEIKENQECPECSNKDWSVWYFPHPYFYGKFELIFETDETIKDAILIPLLNFIDRYGYLGGKWNIGYGRVKIGSIKVKNGNDWIEVNNWKEMTILKLREFGNFKDIVKDDFNYNNICEDNKEYELMKVILGCENFYCKTDRDFKNKILNIPKEIRVIKFEDTGKNFEELIKKLLLMKTKIRNCLRHKCENKYNWKKCHKSINGKKKFDEEKEIDCKIDNIKINCGVLKKWKEFRHSIMGSTEKTTQGTKVIPYIYEEKGKLKGGFISIAGVLNIKGGKNDQRN